MSDDGPQFENKKHAHLRPQYQEGLSEILSMDFDPKDYIHHFPAFVGHLTLARYFSLYEAYQLTARLPGHIAEVGVGLGSASLFFAKLMSLFEPHSVNLVHGFDWFKGAEPTSEEKYIGEGECRVDEETVRRLIRAQRLENTLHIHNLDVTTQLGEFFENHSHMQFKLVFIDCGIYNVVAESLKHLWPRMVPGGVLILDHFSHEFAPGETRAVKDFLPNVKFKQFEFSWMPVAYAIKE